MIQEPFEAILSYFGPSDTFRETIVCPKRVNFQALMAICLQKWTNHDTFGIISYLHPKCTQRAPKLHLNCAQSNPKVRRKWVQNKNTTSIQMWMFNRKVFPKMLHRGLFAWCDQRETTCFHGSLAEGLKKQEDGINSPYIGMQMECTATSFLV